jgi:hypothetical protein
MVTTEKNIAGPSKICYKINKIIKTNGSLTPLQKGRPE